MGRPDPQIKHAILAHLRRHHPGMCRHWFDEIEPVELAAGTLKLLVREQVQLKYLQRCCMEQFTDAAQAVSGRLLGVRFVGEADGAAEAAASSHPTAPNGLPEAEFEAPGPTRAAGDVATDADEHMLISPDYSFGNFVIGPGNELAHAAAVAVAQKPGQAYNPLVIHGGVGLGKTHLLQAICQAAMRSNPHLRIYYTSCDGFSTQFFDAVKGGRMTEFRHHFRRVDMLVIDDIHDLTRERVQEEFFHTFNSLYHAGKQIVISSDAPPGQIPRLEERLTSRFNCGLVAEIEKPCFETRVAIVNSKSSLRNIKLPEDVASYIAAKIDSNIRELEGAILKVQGLSMVNNARIDLQLAKQAIGEQTASAGSPHPTIQNIIDAVTGYYDVKLTDLLSKRRQKSIALPRQIAMWLARKHTRYSLEEIGGYFGGRDHTTVMHAIKTINVKRSLDTALDHDVSRLEEQVVTQGSQPVEV